MAPGFFAPVRIPSVGDSDALLIGDAASSSDQGRLYVLAVNQESNGPSVLALPPPAELLRNRPDVRAAERSLAAATARIGIEVADLFPRVTFVGTAGLQASTFSGLSTAGGNTYSFGPHISWAAFDLGRVHQRIKAANARRRRSRHV
jgi:outer membrane protein TolC